MDRGMVPPTLRFGLACRIAPSHARVVSPDQSGRTCRCAISATLATRLAYLASVLPSHSVVIQDLATSIARADPMILAPMHSTLLSECDRASHAQNGSWATAANTLGNLLAIIAEPYPTPSTKMPRSHSPRATASAAGYTWSGRSQACSSGAPKSTTS